MKFKLPRWAHWSPAEWKGQGEACREVVENMLGWDLTDFGGGDFAKRGLLLFTVRNGRYGVDKKPYAEKIMIALEEQETPLHFHWSKMEDIINRGGGNLVLELYTATEDEDLSDKDFTVQVDGVTKSVKAGGQVTLEPGDSICLEPYCYHRFWGEPGKGKVLVGEVSMVNDDGNDNRFHETVGRFPEIEEDEEPYRLLASDYGRYV
jgi:D-lyxose ketol-isomerase